MSFEFFVSTDDEVESTNDFEGFIELIRKYNIIASGANDLKTVRELSVFFVKREDFVPTHVIKTIRGSRSSGNFRLNILKFDNQFTFEVAKIDRESLDTPKAIEFWHHRGYFGQGTWNAIYGLYNLCKISVRESKDVFICEEINE